MGAGIIIHMNDTKLFKEMTTVTGGSGGSGTQPTPPTPPEPEIQQPVGYNNYKNSGANVNITLSYQGKTYAIGAQAASSIFIVNVTIDGSVPVNSVETYPYEYIPVKTISQLITAKNINDLKSLFSMTQINAYINKTSPYPVFRVNASSTSIDYGEIINSRSYTRISTDGGTHNFDAKTLTIKLDGAMTSIFTKAIS